MCIGFANAHFLVFTNLDLHVEETRFVIGIMGKRTRRPQDKRIPQEIPRPSVESRGRSLIIPHKIVAPGLPRRVSKMRGSLSQCRHRAALLDYTGTQVVKYTYDAWGKPTSKSGTMKNTLGTVQPFRYRGYVVDEETGLYYLRSRYYNPTGCRFVNADCKLVSGNMFRFLNLFSYCSNAPVAKVDEEGTSELSIQFAQVYGQYAQNITQADGLYPFADIAYLGFGAIAFISLGVFDLFSLAVQRLSAPSREFEHSTAISVPTDLAIPASTASSFPKRRYEMHHIVAQKAPNADPARRILRLCGISVHDPQNLIPISYEFHRVLHNNGYYGYINSVIVSAYEDGKVTGTERQSVYSALNQLRAQIFLWDSISGL